MFENLKKLQADGAQGGEPVNESNCTHDCDHHHHHDK